MKTSAAVIIAVLPNSLKRLVLKWFFGAQIGRGVRLGFGSVLRVDQLVLGDHARIGMFVVVSAKSLRMGKDASIESLARISLHTLSMGSRCTIAGPVTIAGDKSENATLTMGMYSWIFQHCYINVVRPISLGRNVGVGGGTYIFTHGYWLSKLDGYPVSYGSVAIGDNVWLPWGCFIMPGVTIGSNVVVGARAVVTKSVPDGALVAGIPAKIIRETSWQPLTDSVRHQIIDEMLRDYARSNGEDVTVAITDGNSLYRYSSGFVVNLCVNEGTLNSRCFNLCWSLVSKQALNQFAVWSLANYQSSSDQTFDRRTRDLLKHARSVGLRFYPIDEFELPS